MNQSFIDLVILSGAGNPAPVKPCISTSETLRFTQSDMNYTALVVILSAAKDLCTHTTTKKASFPSGKEAFGIQQGPRVRSPVWMKIRR
jgi:hypothetical protein